MKPKREPQAKTGIVQCLERIIAVSTDYDTPPWEIIRVMRDNARAALSIAQGRRTTKPPA